MRQGFLQVVLKKYSDAEPGGSLDAENAGRASAARSSGGASDLDRYADQRGQGGVL